MRRSYTDDSLNSALQDIMSGKLGARKAADQYNVPLSTLRTKVNRLTMSEDKRGSSALLQALEMDKDLSGDECNAAAGTIAGDDSNASTPQPDTQPALEELVNRLIGGNPLRKLCLNNGNDTASMLRMNSDPSHGSSNLSSPKPNALYGDSAKRDTSTPSTSATPQPQNSPQPQLSSMLAESVLFQALLLTVGSLGALQQRADQPVTLRDIFTNLKDMLEARSSVADLSVESILNNGKQSIMDQPLLLQKLQQQQQPPPAPQYAPTHRLPKSETPETNSPLEAHDTNDDPATSILKIPSYKPAAGTPTPTSSGGSGALSARASCSPALLCNNNANPMPNRNGDSPHSAPSPRHSILAAAVAAASNNGPPVSLNRQMNDMSVMSPASLQHRARDSQSPPCFSFRDVIEHRIHRTMNEQANHSMLGLGLEMERGANNSSNSNCSDYKKPTISVVKHIGGADTTRFGAAPNLLATGASPGGSAANNSAAHNSHSYHPAHAHLQHPPHHSHHLTRQEAAALAAGKGTRPKRGKYRNYDRDSLIEAVRAVQRGEMSVHRAGSYFGVPHSTLEYKVKERHLMRPRKREPKPQPGLDGSSSSTASSKNNANIPGHHNSLSKLKLGGANSDNSKLSDSLKGSRNAAAAAAAAAAVAAFPNAPPNGIKLPIFDSAMAVPLQYPANLFWPHQQAAAFGQMQLEYNRNAAQGAAGSMAHRYGEEALRGGGGPASNANTPSPSASPLNIRSTREMAENLYDSVGANGSSILDGIIRQTLDRKSAEVGPSPGSGNTLIDQLLVKKNAMPPYTNSSDHGIATKRAASPLPYAEIKRERNIPTHSSDDDEASCSGAEELMSAYEHNNNNSKSNFSGNGEHHGQQQHNRSRLTSRDSETDASSIRSDLLLHNHNSQSSNKMVDLNGSMAGSGVGVMQPKMEAISELGGTSILQEKLAQIKAEQENEENL